MMTQFILVRHGQTAWNKEERFRGRTDLPLDETGLRQAEAVALQVAAYDHPIALYSSPLQRAMRTAQAIGQATALPVQTEDGLLDIDYGEWAGLSPDEAAVRFPDTYRLWTQTPAAVCFPRGESLAVVRARVTDTVRRLAAAHPGQQVVLVSHLVVCRVMLCTLLEIPTDHLGWFQVDTASLSRFETDGRQARLLCLNDTCHLRR